MTQVQNRNVDSTTEVKPIPLDHWNEIQHCVKIQMEINQYRKEGVVQVLTVFENQTRQQDGKKELKQNETAVEQQPSGKEEGEILSPSFGLSFQMPNFAYSNDDDDFA